MHPLAVVFRNIADALNAYLAVHEKSAAQYSTAEALNSSLIAQLRVCMGCLESKQGDMVIGVYNTFF